MFFGPAERGEGAGRGLCIVKKTTDKVGGRISKIANLGLGTHFILEIPNRYDPDRKN